MQFTGKVEERTSKKGNPYTVLILDITDNYSKVIYLNDAEVELITLAYE